jgi:aspartyl-tRNA(Asn)/glutamyl-tRNA(Gln) amidotransferase subunit A
MQPISALAEGLRSGTCRAQDLFHAAVARHKTFGEVLNAYAVWLEKSACQTAITADAAFRTGVTSGPLQGIPISLKDSFGVEGVPTHVGSVRRLPATWEAEGSIVRRLRRQRGVIVGKTQSTEFALSATGANPYGPAPRNPWAREHHVGAGGSSSGAGVGVLEGSARLALATDTLGSVRIPASVTGTVGVKTSVGRWPTDGIVPLSPTLDSVGLIARTVADAAFGYAAIDGPEDSAQKCWTDMRGVNLAGAKIGIDDSMWRHCDASISRVAKVALDELVGVGAKLVSVLLPEAAEAFTFVQDGVIALAEFDAFLATELRDWRPLLGPGPAALAERGAGASARQYLSDRKRHDRMAATARQRMIEISVIAAPTVTIPPPRLDQPFADAEHRRVHLAMLRNTCVANCLKLCSVTIPVGLDDQGFPVGLEFIGQHNADQQVLGLAWAAERVLGIATERLGMPPFFMAKGNVERG